MLDICLTCCFIELVDVSIWISRGLFESNVVCVFVFGPSLFRSEVL